MDHAAARRRLLAVSRHLSQAPQPRPVAEGRPQRFEGKHCLVTGAGSGFGLRTAELFAEEGAAIVYLVDRRQDRLDSAAAAISDRGTRAVTIRADLGVMEECAQVMDTALATHERLDVLVSNAAAWADEAFTEISDESWRHVLSVNLDAYFALSKRAAVAMKKTGGGSVLFTSSVDSVGHGRGFTSYCVAKAGLLSLCKAIAVECAPDNIRCNCVSPGPADTQQSTDIVGTELMDKWRQEGFPAVPMNRLASVDDIAEAFLFLASDAAQYISGINLPVDGALLAQAYDVPDE